MMRVELPTRQTIDEWDDASLFAVCGYHAVARARQSFSTLNESERILSCLWLLDNQVNNGGVGQWLSECPPQVLGQTVWACERVGAEGAARLVGEIMALVDDPGHFTDDEWAEYVQSLPEALHDRFENCMSAFVRIEPELLQCAYAFARARWSEVRAL
jgi:hypothetical protein